MDQIEPEETTTREYNPGQRPFWMCNPMDWPPIDRFILLASLVLLAPGCFLIGMVWMYMLAPEYLDPIWFKSLVALYITHLAILSVMIAMAVKRRQTNSDWPFFENVIIGGYIVTVMVSGYATGSHFAEGLLLLFFGANITSALANVDKLRFSYWFVIPTMIVMGWADFTGAGKFAPLMELPLVDASGKPVLGWMALRAVIAGILSALIYLCILAVRRWVERENLYREMSTIDGLTRLTNRSSFIERGQEELARVQRQSEKPTASLGCIMIDLDHFKRINDTWGHHAGDKVLVTASKIMMENARQYDEVGRYGGDEFAVLLPGVTLETASIIAERLRERISKAVITVDGNTIPITASLGVACYPYPAIADMNDLLKAADAALYQAKESGRNRVVLAEQPGDVANAVPA